MSGSAGASSLEKETGNTWLWREVSVLSIEYAVAWVKPPANAYDPNSSKALSKPTAADGFKGPKGGDDWVENPNGRGNGWRDDSGKVWKPSGPFDKNKGDSHGGSIWICNIWGSVEDTTMSIPCAQSTVSRNQKKQIEIHLSSFCSLGDEWRFFGALEGVTAIRHVQGVGRGLLIDIDLRYLSEDALRDMIALFWRYGIVLAPLQVLATRKRFAWLSDEQSCWRKSMFGKSPAV
jgi:hypothetical protein